MVYKAIENKMIKIKTKITGEYIIFEGFENGESFWFQKELKKNIVSCSYFDCNLQINYFNDKKINIDFLNDPQWRDVVNRPPDSTDQTRREMTLSEVQTFVRSKDQWSTTQNARSSAANGAAAIAKALGAL